MIGCKCLVLGVIASLMFVGLQVRQTQDIGEGESATNFVSAITATRGLLADHTDVWVKGCTGEELDVGERALFAQLVRTYGQVQYFAWLATQNGILKIDGSEIAFGVAANRHRYPGFARMSDSIMLWSHSSEDYDHDSIAKFADSIASKVAELQEADPDPDYDPALCGM